MLIDTKKLEILKVWYATFTVVMDDEVFTEKEKMEKLFRLRRRLKEESPELEQQINQMKI